MHSKAPNESNIRKSHRCLGIPLAAFLLSSAGFSWAQDQVDAQRAMMQCSASTIRSGPQAYNSCVNGVRQSCIDRLDSVPLASDPATTLREINQSCSGVVSGSDYAKLFNDKYQEKRRQVDRTFAEQKFNACIQKLDEVPVAAGSRKLIEESNCSFEFRDLADAYGAKRTEKLQAIAKVDTSNKKQYLASLGVKHATAIKALEFSAAFLDGTIYLQADNINNRPIAYGKFRDWLALLFESGNYSNITKISSGQFQGIQLKRPGMQSGGILFLLDGGELFPSHIVTATKTERLKSNEEKALVALMISESVR